jgi:hypothetical protein
MPSWLNKLLAGWLAAWCILPIHSKPNHLHAEVQILVRGTYVTTTNNKPTNRQYLANGTKQTQTDSKCQ